MIEYIEPVLMIDFSEKFWTSELFFVKTSSNLFVISKPTIFTLGQRNTYNDAVLSLLPKFRNFWGFNSFFAKAICTYEKYNRAISLGFPNPS